MPAAKRRHRRRGDRFSFSLAENKFATTIASAKAHRYEAISVRLVIGNIQSQSEAGRCSLGERDDDLYSWMTKRFDVYVSLWWLGLGQGLV